MTVKIDLLTLTARDLQDLLSRSIVTSVDIVSRYLDQIEKHNRAGLSLNAVISTAPRDQLTRHARRLDDERLQGNLRGPFHGVPILLKDAYSTPELGMPTSCGSLALLGAKAKANATVVDKLIAAGMIVIAKANLSELGNMKGFGLMAGWSAAGGQTQSPYVKGGVTRGAPFFTNSGPAGSSSGSAAGVAAGFAPMSLGTESDGSVIMPACRAGLYALKATLGSIDDSGVQPALRRFDCLGGLTKTVTDLAGLTAIIQGKPVDAYLPQSTSWEGLKLGFVDPTQWRVTPQAIEPVDGFLEQTDTAMSDAQKKIQSLGGKVVSAAPLIAYDDIVAAMPDMEAMEDLNPYQLRECLGDWLSSFEGAPQSIEELIAFNEAHADEEFSEVANNQDLLKAVRDCKVTEQEFARNFKALREKGSSSIIQLLADHDIDVIIGPCDSRFGSVASASGFPVANLPLGFADFNGRGFGLHMIAPPDSEAKMFQIMAAWEATFPENVRPPPLLYA